VDRESGLTPERLSLLSVLAYVGPQPVQRLAELEGVSSPAISRSLGFLERDGLARRERDQSDRRVVRARPTKEGLAVIEEARMRRIEVLANELGSASRSELDRLEEAVRILSERLGARPPPAV